MIKNKNDVTFLSAWKPKFIYKLKTFDGGTLIKIIVFLIRDVPFNSDKYHLNL